MRQQRPVLHPIQAFPNAWVPCSRLPKRPHQGTSCLMPISAATRQGPSLHMTVLCSVQAHGANARNLHSLLLLLSSPEDSDLTGKGLLRQRPRGLRFQACHCRSIARDLVLRLSYLQQPGGRVGGAGSAFLRKDSASPTAHTARS